MSAVGGLNVERPDTKVYGDRGGFHVEVGPSFGVGDTWQVSIVNNNYGNVIQPAIRDRAKALSLGQHLYEVLLPEYEAERQQQAARNRAWEAGREAERPAREAAARARREAARKAPEVEVGQCPECEHLAPVDEFDEPGYECGSCGSTGRGDDGRRCDQCHRFRARASDYSCPACEQPLEEVTLVQARQLPDGELLLANEAT